LQNKQEEVDSQESLHKIVTAEGNVLADYSKLLPDLRSCVMEHIGEFEMELETRYYHYYCYWIVCQVFFYKEFAICDSECAISNHLQRLCNVQGGERKTTVPV